jgi:hypothetical protein
VATFLATPSSANLRTAVTDETGSGALVFATSPTLVTPALGTPASGVVTNLTGTASININGTVGATTATTGVFTTVTADNIIAPNVAAIGQFSWDNSSTTTPVAKPVVTPSSTLIASIQGRMRGCLLLDNGQVNYYLKATDWTQKEDGSASVLTGADGMVMVEIPAFYVKNESSSTLWKPVISATPLPGYDLHPAFIKDGVAVPYRYYSAYDACVFKSQAITGATAANPVVITSNNHGLQTGGTCFISGVIGMTEINNRTFTVTRVDANTFSLDGEDGTLHTPYVSGGTLAAYISGGNLDNATSLVDTAADKLSSVSGVYPMVGLTRNEFRLLAVNRGAGWRMGDFTLWSAIGILLAVEAQTLNSQGVYGAGNTGGTYLTSSGVQSDSPHTIAGAGNALGNGSTDTSSGAAVDAKPGTSYCKYRGIENFWGNCWNWTDGIVIYSEGNSAGNKVFAYWNNITTQFADVANASASTAIPTGYGLLGEIANTLATTRYATQFAQTNTWALVPTNFSTTSSHGTTDFYFTNSGWRVLLVGGGADVGGAAGAFAFAGTDVSTRRARTLGARLSY